MKDTETCPINDIVYNNQENYSNNNINYTSIKINTENKDENEYIHYTNEKTENFIITNLSIIGVEGLAVPCGSNDNDEFNSISIVDINKFCKGENTSYKYYYFNELSSVGYWMFFRENNLSSIRIYDYRNNDKVKKMTLFSTGYFSLSDEDIKNLKKPSNINKNNDKYLKIMNKYYIVCFIFVIILGASFLFICQPIMGEEGTIRQIIVICYIISICLIIIICGIIEMAMENKLFLFNGYIPDFIFNDDVNKIKNKKVGLIHMLAYLFIFIIQIPLLIINIHKFKNKDLKEKKPLISENEKSTELSLKKENYIIPDSPQSSDFWNPDTQN